MQRSTRLPWHVRVVFVALLLLAPAAAPAGTTVMGDSLGDEYAFPIFTPAGGDRRTAKNYVELLSELRGGVFDFGAYSTASRGTPRNEGFEYNWARDGCTSAELLAEGQHTGAAGVIAAGDADAAFLTLGGNDFRSVFIAPDPPAALGQAVPALLQNVATIAQSILAADPAARLVIANVPDLRHLPELRGAVAAGLIPQAFADAVAGAIDAYNQQLAQAFADNDRVAIADLDGVIDGVMAGDSFVYGGVTIDRATPGNETNQLFVDAVHPGTVGQGLIANAFLDASNDKFATDYALLTEAEVLAAAAAPNPIPLPAGAWAAVAAAPVLCFAARRRGAA